MLDHGGTFGGRVRKFKVDGGLVDTDEGLEAYRVIAEACDLFIMFDHVNLTELAGGETLMRYMQLVEDSHRDKFLAKQAASSSSTSSSVREEIHLYLGTGERDGLMVCPALTEHLGEKLKSQAKIFKFKREAREERRLLKVPEKR